LLTHQFWQVGDYPRIVPSSSNNMIVHYIGFNNSFWEFQFLELVSDVYSYTLTIDDSIISLLDCIVRSTSFVISRPMYSIDSLITVHNQVVTLLNDTGNGLQLFRDTAAPSVAIAIQ
uniref:Uncharacterized protein n=1 Tax=Amphimedon queenslandica TaxID=400682 RepID=A0A1X7V4N8_AMPQE